MSLRRYLFSGITSIIMIFLLILDVNYLLSYILALFIIFFGYYVIAVLRNKNRIHLLNEDCNPEAFLNRCEKQGRIIGNPHILSSYLAIDMSAGLVCSGEFQSAKYCLEEIDKTKISKAGYYIVPKSLSEEDTFIWVNMMRAMNTSCNY